MPPKFTIKEIPISQIDNNFGQIEGVPENPRTITTEDFQNLKRSLEDDPEFLYLREPLVYPLNGRYIAIAGNQRIRALKELPIEFTPAKILDADTPVEDLIRWAVKDNTNKGEWDWDALSNGEWPEDKLTDWGLDMPEEWGEAHNPNPEEDEIPEPPKTPVSKLGDLWLLDGHRVLCGDSTDKATVERLMADKKADMVFTDPPYGVEYQSNQRTKTPKFAVIQNDNQLLSTWIPILQSHSKGFIFVWTTWKVYSQWENLLYKQFGEPDNVIIWNKAGGGMGDLKKTFSTDYEMAIVYNRDTEIQGKRIGSVWDIGKDFAGNYRHPTQKPVALAAQAIQSCTKPKQTVLDLFLGSGSTLIACEQTNRQCYGLELDPSYVDVVCSRWQTLTGTMPILESTGEAHDFIDVQ